MDNQYNKIKGYRDLSQEEIDIINEIKEKEEEVEDLVKRLMSRVEPGIGEPLRLASIGRTNLQLGFMALVKSVTKI